MAMNWYIVHAYSNFEEKVAESLRTAAAKRGLDEFIEDIMVPKEEVVEVKRGKRVNSEKKLYPGYVLMKADMNDDIWHLVKSTPKVTGFLGANNKPQPITEREAKAILQVVEEGVEAPRSTVTFDIGEDVKVVDGPFASFDGVVEEVDEASNKLKVSVSIFGRPTPVELEYAQVEKA